MEDLYIKGKTGRSPLVDFKATGELLLEGRSICEDPLEFYTPVIDWVKALKENPPKSIILKIQLDFFNTASSKILIHLFSIFDSIHKKGNEVKIIWYYNSGDEEILQAGMDYESLIDVPFTLVEISQDGNQ